MDRRAFLAVVLTFMLLIAWQYFVIGPKSREIARRRAIELQQKRRADSLKALEERAEADTSRAAPERGEPFTAQAEEGEGTTQSFFDDTGSYFKEQKIQVVTERLKLTLSSLGGEVVEAELLDFVKSNGDVVELVPDTARGGFAVDLIESGKRVELSDVHFDVMVNGYHVSGDSTVYLGEGSDSVEVVFIRRGSDGGKVGKAYIFRRRGYDFDLRVAIRREGALSRTTDYELRWGAGLEVTERNRKYDLRQFASLGMIGDEFYQEALRKFGKVKEKAEEGTVIWAGARTKYFLVASVVSPESRRSGKLLLRGDAKADRVGFGVMYPFRGDPRIVEDHYRCYIGPLDMKGLKAYGVGLERTIDLGKLRFLSILILKFTLFLRKFIPNYGIIIIILSVMTKLLFYRLTHKSFKSMKDMQRLQPKIEELKARYKDDKERLNREMMKLYKEAGVNPLGGCFPLLLQLPVFIALYNVLRNTIELRGAHFVWWINDLSSPDILFTFNATIPFIGNEFHLLPILMGGAMYLQSKLGGSPTGGGAPGQSAMMSTMMPILLTFFFYSMPSGLVLYWLVNNVMTIAQQYVVHKEVEAEERAAESSEPAKGKKKGKKNIPVETKSKHYH